MGFNIPAKFAAGTTFDQLVTLTDQPAPDWVLTLFLRGPQNIDLTATPEGTAHRISATASTASQWAGGVYRYVLRASRGGEVVEVESGTMSVTADITAMDPGIDQRSHARKVLDSINAVLEKRATQDQQRYVINNRELWRTPLADLLKLRDTYRAEVRREEAAAAGRSLWGPAVRVRF